MKIERDDLQDIFLNENSILILCTLEFAKLRMAI